MRIDAGDTAWLLVCTALVLFMTPGLAFFYGGMVRSKHVLTMLMQNFTCIAVVSVTWGAVGFSLAFGPDAGGGLVGTLRHAGLAPPRRSRSPGFADLTVPPLAFAAFQAMFAIITAALITGAIADRVRFGGFVVFITVWSAVVYPVLAHWVVLAGRLAAAGADCSTSPAAPSSRSTAAPRRSRPRWWSGSRRGWPREVMAPHSLPLTLLGAGILWFGWFGFNAGSRPARRRARRPGAGQHALRRRRRPGRLDRGRTLRTGHATTLGAASGAVAGLVAITPSAGYLSHVVGAAGRARRRRRSACSR